ERLEDAGVLGERGLAEVALVADPEDVVAIEDAPEGGEGVAPAEVEAADEPAGRQRPAGDEGLLEVGIDQPFHRLEAGLVLLADPGVAHRAALGLDELGGDARAVAPGGAHLLEVLAVLPLAVKEAAPAERRGQSDEPAVRDGEHGADGAVEVVGDAGGLVDDEQVDAAVA